MKISKYTTRLSVSDKSWLLYNAVTDRFVLYSKELDFGKQTDLDVLKKESEQFYEQLEKGGFVIPNDKDETEEVVKKGLENCKNDKEYYLIINPTLNCNFRCWYCYENHSGRKKMRPETVESVKRMIDRLCDTEHIEFLHLSFFGGEPLLYYIDTVKPIIGHVENLKKERGLGYSIHFTTNGYLITNRLIEDLKKVHANVSFQITLDGSKEEHDKVRRSASGSGSYDRILANIKKLLENGFHVGLRLNYSGKNVASMGQVQKDIEPLSGYGKSLLTIDFQRVWQDEAIESTDELLLKTIADFQSKFQFVGDFFNRVNSYRNPCYGDLENECIVNYDGGIYKCTARDFTEELCLGTSQNDGSILWKHPEYARQRLCNKFSKKICQSCKIFPLCGAGCSQTASEVKDACTLCKSEMEKDNIVLTRFYERIVKAARKEESCMA